MIDRNGSTFGERLYSLRKEKNLTRVRLGELAKISDRSIVNYENGSRYPGSVEIVKRLADALGTTSVYLLGDEGAYIEHAREIGGSKSADEVRFLVEQLTAAFAGGKLPEEDKDAMMAALSEAYFESKKLNERKYSSRKGKK
ncbi:MAG: helix-turn-helix domain-containing protein [Clostridia bacterium]|nr:helix-turn-helix domain-containing protein [Clostridia bacterium]